MNDDLYHPWLPNLRRESEILAKIGVNNVEELLRVIPNNLRIKGGLGIRPEEPMKPWEIELDFQEKIKRNIDLPLNRIFAGGPVCPHYVHPVVQYLLSRGEFLTAYTPYQPEINQGVLQALYEYQSLMAELLGVEVVNAGMYDGATSLAEALLMAIRVTGRKEVLLPKTLYRQYDSVVRTYLFGPGAIIHYYDVDNKGQPDINEISNILSVRDVAAVVVENPSGHGVVNQRMKEIHEEASRKGALSIALVEPLLMSIVNPPGDYGYEVVVAEGQSLGLPMNGGGPLLGIFGIKHEQRLLRQLPGRLIGATLDADGKRGFMMILQTREQHIRREKATSNITTNTALNAIGAAIHVSLLGEKGLRWVASHILELSNYAAVKLKENRFELLYDSALFFKNVSYKIPCEIPLDKIVAERKILPYSLLNKNVCLSCFTEIHSREDVEYLVQSLRVM
jgi:glycine dehydrogenase subunit 1